jgi:tungstate transport system substrate-binding protein
MKSRARLSLFLSAAILLAGAPATPRAGHAAPPAPRLRLATTTSTENSGLLGALLPPFERQAGCRVDVISVGTGKALKLGEAGDVDVVLVHARELEDRFVSEGFGVSRRDLMYNDFVLLGPKGDPAKAAGSPDAEEAFRRIARSGAPFVSRGDRSGTHLKEQAIWRAAGIEPKGAWYVESGLGMGEAITMAGEKDGYTLSDRGTAVAWRGKSRLAVLFQGGAALRNPYGVIAVNPKRNPAVRHDLALRLIDFLTGAEGQSIIAGFKVGGEPLFFTYPRPGAPGR